MCRLAGLRMCWRDDKAINAAKISHSLQSSKFYEAISSVMDEKKQADTSQGGLPISFNLYIIIQLE